MNTESQPLVSIVIPVYNQRPDFLKECIDSALKQTYPNIEIVVSNNHSTNETPDVLNSYHDKRLRVMKPPEHLPISPNFQWAAAQAKGEYITFLPSDDWLEKECIEELVNLIHPHPEVVMAFCGVRQYYNGIKAHFINLKPGICRSDDEIVDYVKMTKPKGWLIGGLFRKSVYDKIGGISNGGLTFTSDRWLFIQMAMHGNGAYSDKSYGIFRNENVARKQRTLEYSRDALKVFGLIEEKCLPKMRNGKRIIEKERKKMAFDFLRGIPGSVQAGDIRPEELTELLGNLKKLSNSRLIQTMIRLYSKKKLIRPFSILFYFESKYRNAKHKIRNLFSK